jgi:light-regulated signal transduction histidine kinase (bacteriophytochrome)/CheY-like chemotaxis protein
VTIRALHPKIDLTNCDREPIHILAAIQPFGFLLSVTADWAIARASANLAVFTGATPQAMLGRPLAELFRADAIHAIRNRVVLLRGPNAVERIFALPLLKSRPGENAPTAFDVAVHFSGSEMVIEAEPAKGETLDAANQVRTLMSRLQQAEGMTGFLREASRQVRAITGFDRVMVYRFDHSGAGEVVAESLKPGTDSFLGLNYPATDIPAQARALYLRSVFRIIADVNAAAIPILPELSESGAPLDQSISILRSVSPIHIEYLRNMGVEASLSISITVEGRLWGLFACHHYQPRLPSFAQRSAAELYGQMFSLLLESREHRGSAEYETRARGAIDRMMVALGQDGDLLARAQWLGESIMDIVPADGVGVIANGGPPVFAGLVPNAEQFGRIVQALIDTTSGEIATTDHIAGLVESAAEHAHIAAGLLAIPLSRAPRDYVVLFRAERLRTVRWAGNPDKPVEYGPHGARLTPRKSFEEWSQLVKGRALPFSEAELRVGRTLRTALLEVVLRLSEDVDIERRRAFEQQQLLIAELNHRVRNILALIRGLVGQSHRDGLSTEEFIRTLDSRVQALARAHDQITTRRWGPGRLVELIQSEANAYLGAKRDRVVLDGPELLINPDAFTVLALVFHELTTNAAKYGALSDHGRVKVSWHVDASGALQLTWRESGGPVVTAPTRRGFGSTLIERSIPFELGGTAKLQYRVSGIEAEFSIPGRYLAGIPTGATAVDYVGETGRSEGILAGMHVLLIEDSMLIALSAEDALRELGAAQVTVAPSAAAARQAMTAGRIDFAVLDFNLGNETSLPIAEELVGRGVPVVMATGYGTDLDLPAVLKDVPVVTKPYDLRTLAPKVTQAMRVP